MATENRLIHFLAHGVGKIEYPCMNLNLTLHILYKDSKWIKLVGENIHNFGLGQKLLDMIKS
jgi:hypothetical protein